MTDDALLIALADGPLGPLCLGCVSHMGYPGSHIFVSIYITAILFIRRPRHHSVLICHTDI